MTNKKLLIIDSEEIHSYKDIFREFEGGLLITYSEATRVMHFPTNYDIYLFNTADVDLGAIWKLRKENPRCRIYAVNGGRYREGKSLGYSDVICMNVIFKCLENKLAERIYKDSQINAIGSESK